MAFTKITSTELNSRGATTLPNQPAISATALKQEFDAPAKNIVAPKVNNLIDELEATTAAASLGAAAPTGREGTTVQEVVNDISSDLAVAEEKIDEAFASVHTHANKALLDTYTQANSDLADAVTKTHEHFNKALLDTYSQTEANLADAVTKKHTHSNQALLDTYDQTNTDITDAVGKKHTHSNQSLLDTYSQTEVNLADAVSKKHSHSNKNLLDTYNQSNSDIADAISNMHSHSNKSLLDSYDQTNANISDAVTKKHTHSNKSLLDTYSQTESDLADAVTKKHAHSNKAVLDKFGENSGGNPTYNGSPIGGGGISNAFKVIKVGSTNITASGEDTLELVAGTNVTLTPDATNKKVTVTSTGGGGGGGGDMYAADYDSDNTVKTAGGIKAYFQSQNLPAASGGTDKSLVTTGDKYNWNNKLGKVSNPTSGNFAAVDSYGNVVDSGHKHSDYVTDISDRYATGDTAETTLADGDYFPFYDTSASAKRKTLWSNIKSVLKTYFDTLYNKITVSIATTGTASTSGIRKQTLTIDNVTTDIANTSYMEATGTLSTSTTTDVAFTNNAITSDSVIEFACSKWDLVPDDISISNHTCTVRLPKVDTAISVTVRIYLR